jgi:hypothetical protein
MPYLFTCQSFYATVISRNEVTRNLLKDFIKNFSPCVAWFEMTFIIFDKSNDIDLLEYHYDKI